VTHTLQQVQDNIAMHRNRQQENAILRNRYPNVDHYFDVADEIRAIRLRNAEQLFTALTN
jgi:hypothetical protein